MHSQILYSGVSIDTIFVVAMFFLGFAIKWIIDNCKRSSLLREKKEFYLNTIKSLITPIQQQSELYLKLAMQIIDVKTQSVVLEEKNELYSSLVAFDNNEELYTIFVKKHKGNATNKFEQYRNMINTIGYLSEIKTKAQINFESFSKDLRKYENIWTDSCKDLINYIEESASDILNKKVKKSDDTFFAQVDDITADWQKLKDRWQIYKVKENLINPISKLCAGKLEDKRALVLLKIIRNANNAHMNFISLKEQYSVLFKHIANMTEVQKEKINEAYNYYLDN